MAGTSRQACGQEGRIQKPARGERQLISDRGVKQGMQQERVIFSKHGTRNTWCPHARAGCAPTPVLMQTLKMDPHDAAKPKLKNFYKKKHKGNSRKSL